MNIKFFIKILLNISLNFLRKIFYLNEISSNEKKGNLLSLTSIKFIPGSEIKLPFQLGRTIRGLSFKNNLQKDPFGNFALLMNRGQSKKKLIQYLFKKYKSEKSLDAATKIKLKKNSKLAKFPVWALVMPWDKKNIKNNYLNYPNQFIYNRSKNGMKLDKKNLRNISNHFYSKKVVASQFNQTKNLLESIKKNGLKKSKSLPKVNILINGKKWRWCMSDEGNHRAYILSIIGKSSLHCVVDKVIYKNKIRSCYNVKNGLYSPKEAEKIFNHFFLGDKCIRGLI